ncbi:MAG TPA: hotdog fold domain-containing protein [Candidatus Thermoplasmatota archaeon]|nr:hotdog fold domain-containing protein [Candidatus Thermoplasmatota archaeon]
MMLDNDPANLCIGCGPENPIGLRLQFEATPEGARTRLVVRPEHQGAPERLHSGLLYLAMLETANWSVFARLGRIGLPTMTGAIETLRWVPVGETLTIAGRWDAQSRAVSVEAAEAKGAPVARLRREFALPGRAEFMQRMGYATLPRALEGLLPE